MADLNKLYAEEYDSSKSYSSGDKCVYNGEWYQANDTTTGTFDEDKWNKKYIVDYLSGGSADGTATTDDVLDGKTFGSSSGTGQVGTMPDKSGTSTKATTITSDDTYTYLNIPTSGYYDTSSKLYMENSNLAKYIDWSDTSKYDTVTKTVKALNYGSVSNSVNEFMGAGYWNLFRTNMNSLNITYDKKPLLIRAFYSSIYEYIIDVNSAVCVATLHYTNSNRNFAIAGIYNQFYFDDKSCCIPFGQYGETDKDITVILYYPK